MAPVPRISVPMNFGRHLLDSPTHSTLELRANKGTSVRASSVILSFNSPLIDHMTTTLHLTSVDMEEFSEEAVRYFVDAAYTGESPPVSRNLFRDINKLANVFKMDWLVARLAELYANIAEAIDEACYEGFSFLFDEGAFVLTQLKSRQFMEIALTKIRSLNGERDFISNYLENLKSLSRQQLELIIELAGSNVEYVIEPLTLHLVAGLSKGEAVVSDSCKFLLENCDLYQCQQNNPGACEQVFDVLEQVCVSQGDFKWLFQLQKKVMRSPTRPSAPQQKTVSSLADPCCSEKANVRAESRVAAEELGDWMRFSKFEAECCEVDYNVIEINVPESKCGEIIFKIAEIQLRTNTRVDLKECKMNLVTISGVKENTLEAKRLVNNILTETVGDQSRGRSRGLPQGRSEGFLWRRREMR